MHKLFIKIVLLSICAASFASAAVIYVDKEISDGFWQGAYASLKNALAVAQTGDEVWVAQGVYTPGVHRNDSFIINQGVKLYGGFYGGEVSIDDRDVHAHRSVLSGDIGVIDNINDNCYHVITCSGSPEAGALLDGFQIRNGNAEDEKGGGGLLVESEAVLLIRDCHFLDNHSKTAGGAAMVKGRVDFEDCLFELNRAESGGAVACFSDEDRYSEFDHCSFIKNTAKSGSALNCSGKPPVYIDSCVFWMNSDESKNINSIFAIDDNLLTSVTNSAFDDPSGSFPSASGLIYYSCKDKDGPFLNSNDYPVDNAKGIPSEWGWFSKSNTLVLNIRVFLEGAF